MAESREGVEEEVKTRRIKKSDLDALSDQMDQLFWMVKDLLTRLRLYGKK